MSSLDVPTRLSLPFLNMEAISPTEVQSPEPAVSLILTSNAGLNSRHQKNDEFESVIHPRPQFRFPDVLCDLLAARKMSAHVALSILVRHTAEASLETALDRPPLRAQNKSECLYFYSVALTRLLSGKHGPQKRHLHVRLTPMRLELHPLSLMLSSEQSNSSPRRICPRAKH